MKLKQRIKYKIQNIRYHLYLFYLESFGYIDKDGTPLKCTCGCEDLEDCNEDYLDGLGSIRLEYDCRCKKCGKILGHWAYGYWEAW